MGRAYIWWEEAPLGGIRAHKARQRPEGDTLAPLALAPLAHAAKPLRLYRTSVPPYRACSFRGLPFLVIPRKRLF